HGGGVAPDELLPIKYIGMVCNGFLLTFALHVFMFIEYNQLILLIFLLTRNVLKAIFAPCFRQANSSPLLTSER
ncbi:hypothetical protein RCV49_09415, partial [Escherichia marmotae]|nr:hypothetical protein [Escherichia marmotae]